MNILIFWVDANWQWKFVHKRICFLYCIENCFDMDAYSNLIMNTKVIRHTGLVSNISYLLKLVLLWNTDKYLSTIIYLAYVNKQTTDWIHCCISVMTTNSIFNVLLLYRISVTSEYNNFWFQFMVPMLK